MRIILAVLTCLLSTAALAETGYVTDVLRLGLHNAEDTSDPAFRNLASGDSFEILQRSGFYAQVQLPDGTTGWVKANYIVTEPPARYIVNQVQTDNARLEAELAEVRASYAEPAAVIETLRGESADLTARLEAATARADEFEADYQSMLERQARYQYSLPYTWVGGAILVCLIAGFLLGLWWVDRQARRRHGGIRVL